MIIAGKNIAAGVSALHYKWETVEDACKIALEKTLGAGFAGPFIAEYPDTAETVRRFKRLPGEIILRREKCRDNI